MIILWQAKVLINEVTVQVFTLQFSFRFLKPKVNVLIVYFILYMTQGLPDLKTLIANYCFQNSEPIYFRSKAQ